MTDTTVIARAARSFSRAPLSFLSSLPGKLARKLVGGLARTLTAPASRSGFLASLYFTFLSTHFYREHKSVLAGMAEFRATRLAQKTTFGGFRRNVHRIEKGLSMQPRRATFGEGYIGQTVAQFVSAQSENSRIDAGERKWAGDVLSAYFDVVTDTPAIAAARKRFEATGYRRTSEPAFVPYSKDQVTPSGIAFEDLRQLFVERRSVRWYEDRPVPQELISKAVEAAGWAPTACNRQPYRFHVFHGPRAVQIGALAGGTAGWVHQIPCLIVVVGDMSNYIEERDRHLIYIDGGLASMQLLLALQTLGLSTVSINWPDVEEREQKMAKELSLAPFERAVMLIGVGYGTGDGQIPYSQKKPIDLMLREDR